MWMNEIMETVPYYDTLLLVQFILYTLQTYCIITRGIQLEDGGRGGGATLQGGKQLGTIQ